MKPFWSRSEPVYSVLLRHLDGTQKRVELPAASHLAAEVRAASMNPHWVVVEGRTRHPHEPHDPNRTSVRERLIDVLLGLGVIVSFVWVLGYFAWIEWHGGLSK